MVNLNYWSSQFLTRKSFTMDKKNSYSEFSAQYKDKNIVVLEFGRQYTRCGFASESAPKAIIKTALRDKHGSLNYLHAIDDPKELQLALTSFIERIYFNYLAASPKEKRVVIIESVFVKSTFRKTLAKVFFEQFNAPSILYVPDHLMALASLGLSTGLVLDLGYEEAISIAVVGGVTLLDGSQFTSLGAKSFDQYLHRKLTAKDHSLKPLLTPDIVEDIRAKACFVAPYDRGLELANDKLEKTKNRIKQAAEQNIRAGIDDGHQIWFSLADQMDECSILEDSRTPMSLRYSLGGCRTINIPGSIREGICELFFEVSGHEQSLATMVIETILLAPIDSRRSLGENIVVVGGLANLPGLEHRLSHELINMGKHDSHRRQPPISFKLHKTICPKNYACWLGASMFCTSNFVELRSTSREQWQIGGMKTILEWSDLVR